MQNIYQIIPIYFIATLSLCILSYLIGSVFLKNLRFNQQHAVYCNLFLNTITGVVILALLVSLYKTRFITVNLFFIIILLFFFIEKQFISGRNNTDPIQKKRVYNLELKSVFYVIIILLICFAWQLGVTLNLGEFPVNNVERDSFYYSEISKNLMNSGFENTFINANLINEKYRYPTPYHYFDLWINGLVSKAFGINHTLSLYLVTFTFFSAMFVLGLLSVFEVLKIKSKYKIIISVLLLFVSGIHITDELLHLNHYSSQMEGLNEKYGGKMLAGSCFVLLFFILFLSDKKRLAYLSLLCLPIISVSFAPAIYGGISIFAISRFIIKKSERYFYLRLIIYTITSAILMAFFYYLFKKSELDYRFNKQLFDYSDLKSFSFFYLKFYLVELILKMYAQPFLFIINYFPFFLILLYMLLVKELDKNIKSILVLLLIIWLIGLFSFSTFYLLDDANQFYTNSLILWHVFFSVLLIQYIGTVQNRKTLVNVSAIIIFMLGLFNNINYSFFSHRKVAQKIFSNEYLISINNYSKRFQTETKGAILYDSVFYNNLKISYPLEFYSVPFTFSQNMLVPFNLTDPAVANQKNIYQIEKHLLNNPFSMYMNQETNQTNLAEDSLKYQIGFIKKYDIKYILSSQNDRINWHQYFRIDTIFTDKLSGQKFVALN